MNGVNKLLIAILACQGLTMSGISYANEAGDTVSTGTVTTIDNTVDDKSLEAMTKTALASYAGKITVVVSQGVVHLSGQVDSNTDYERAVTLAQSIKGVDDVNVDNLTVKDSQNPLSDTYVTAKVKGALLKSDIMGKDIPAWSVSVETKDGQVYLSGTVSTDQEKQNIMNVVKTVKGVTKISDEIGVSSVSPTQITK